MQRDKIDSHPVRLEIQPTGRCNLDCRFCDSATGEDLPKKIWSDFVRDALNEEVERISVTGGGEPLLRPEVVSEISKIAEKNGISGDIVTNGSFFPESLMERLVEDEWDFVSMSIHSPKAETCDYIRRRKGSFEKSIKNAKKLNKIKDKKGKDKPHLNFIYVITNHNEDQIKEAAKLCEDIGFSSMIFRIVEGQENSSYYPKDKEKIKKNIDEIRENTDLGINLHFDEDNLTPDSDEVEEITGNEKNGENKNPKKNPYCFTPFFEVVVFPDGKVAPCCTFYSSENLQGQMPNIQEKSFSEIWENDLEYFRKAMFGKKELPMPCRDCRPASSHKGESWAKYIKTGESDYT